MANFLREWTPVLWALLAAGAVLIVVGLLGRFLVRTDLDLESIDCDCEADELMDVAVASGVSLPQHPALLCFDAACAVCDLRRARGAK